MSAAPGAAPPTAGAETGGFVPISPSHYRLELPLRFTNVAETRARGLGILRAASGDAVTFDLSGVSSVDSAGLALLVDWLAGARAAGRTLRYTQLPQQLRALAELSEVDRLFGS